MDQLHSNTDDTSRKRGKHLTLDQRGAIQILKRQGLSFVFCQVKIPEMSVRIPSFCTGNFPVLSGMGRADQETATFCRINACSIR